MKDVSLRKESNANSSIGQYMRKRLIPVFMALFLEDLKPEFDLWTFLEKICVHDTELEEAIRTTNEFVKKSSLSKRTKDHINKVKFRYFLTEYITSGKNLELMNKITTSSILQETHKPTYLLFNKGNQKEFIKYLNFFKVYPIELEMDIRMLEYDPKSILDGDD